MTPNKPKLNFVKIESLRRHMLLTKTDMSKIMGVSRTSYTAWIKGSPVRQKNDKHIRNMLRKMLRLLENGWPHPRMIGSPQKERMKMVSKELGLIDK